MEAVGRGRQWEKGKPRQQCTDEKVVTDAMRKRSLRKISTVAFTSFSLNSPPPLFHPHSPFSNENEANSERERREGTKVRPKGT
jgi:hypothetical protein